MSSPETKCTKSKTDRTEKTHSGFMNHRADVMTLLILVDLLGKIFSLSYKDFAWQGTEYLPNLSYYQYIKKCCFECTTAYKNFPSQM